MEAQKIRRCGNLSLAVKKKIYDHILDKKVLDLITNYQFYKS